MLHTMGRLKNMMRRGGRSIEALMKRDPSTLNEEEKARIYSFLMAKKTQEDGRKRQQDFLLMLRRGLLGRGALKKR